MELQDFNIREADWKIDGKQLSNIRRLVFIVEQEVPQERNGMVVTMTPGTGWQQIMWTSP